MKKNLRLDLILKFTIILVVTTGGVFVLSAMPNIVQTYPFLKRIFKNKNINKTNKSRVKKTLDFLFENGYVDKKGDRFVLTTKGELILLKINPNLIKKFKWDGKWRIVSFDVRENQRKKRDLFRQELKSLGFVQMQRSVWISPYPCEKYIELMRAEHNFGKNMQYILAEKISEDGKFKKYFNLKK